MLKLNPVEGFGGYAVLFHGDAIGYRAHELAEVATHAGFIDDGVGVIGVAVVEFDGLVRGVFAGDVAQAAVDAFFLIYFGNVVVVDVEVFPMGDGGQAFANKIGGGGVSLVVHPIAEATAEVVNDAETMRHNGGAHLHVCGAEQHKLHGIFPGADAANAGYGNGFGEGVLRNGGEHFEGYGLNGGPAIPTKNRLAGNVWIGHKGI